MKPIGIVIATSWEAAPVVKAFSLQKQNGAYTGKRHDHEIRLAISGVGFSAASKAANALVLNGAGMLVSAGFCGALEPRLQVGDVLNDRVISSDSPARNQAERKALTQRANALAVDMETQAIIETGTRRGVPIRICRVVSDRFDDDLTPLFGQDNGFSPLRIAFRLLNPSVWALAARLRRNSAVAHVALVQALDALLKQPTQP